MTGPWRANPIGLDARGNVRVLKPKAPLEWQLQAAMIAEFHKLEAEGWPLTVAGDMNAAKRSPSARAMAKVTGLTAGEPDVRVYFSGGQLCLIEVKRAGGLISHAQASRHARLAELGFRVDVFWLADEQQARRSVRDYAEIYCRGKIP